MSSSSRPSRALRLWLGSLWLLCVALAGTTGMLIVANWGVGAPGLRPPFAMDAVYVVLPLMPATVGAIIAARRPTNALGWLFLAGGLNELVAITGIWYGRYVLFAAPGRGSGGHVAIWVGNWTVFLSLGALAFVLLLYPDGALPSPRWRPLAIAGACVVGVAALAFALKPGVMAAAGVPALPNPLGVEALAVVLEPVSDALALLVMVLLLAAAWALLVRFRRARGLERQQVKWLLFPAGVAAVSFTLASVLHMALAASFDALSWLVWTGVLGAAAIPIGAAFGVFRYRLLDIDLVIRRSLVYGALWVLITVAYLSGAALFGFAAGGRVPVQVAILGTIAATVGLQPVRRWLDRLAARWAFGERPTYQEVFAELGETLERSGEPSDMAPQIADTVRRALGLRWARVLVDLGEGAPGRLELLGSAGIGMHEHAAVELSLPLLHDGDTVGVLQCGPKVEGRLSEADHELLATLGRQAGLALRTARLAVELAARLDEIRRQAEQLAASRARLLHAHDSERRRLERNLHDGVQQELVSLMTKAQLAQSQLRRGDADRTAATLVELQAEARQALEDLRALAAGIYPQVLSDRGLVAAVEARTARLPVGVRVEADPQLRERRFPPNVEAAAYFLCSEGLANVLKHAEASRVVVRLAAFGRNLLVEVEDDGVGFELAAAGGTGLAAMRDRLEALGGALAVATDPGGGTRLLGRLPLPVPEPSDV